MQKKPRKRKTTQSGSSNIVTFPNSLDEPTHTTEKAFDAQELIYDAWEAPSRQKRIKLAHQALTLWSDCADAYVLLAEHAENLEEALKLYEDAVAAGERALGKREFEEDIGHFWLIHETRPYMRARCGLARMLEQAERYNEAITHYRELLRLNPNDNQGIRYLLLRTLIAAERDAEAWVFANESPTEIMAAWLYPKALLAFRRDGGLEDADKLLREAIGRNRYVPDYLLGRKPMPRTLPDYVGMGDESEAAAFVAEFAMIWHGTNDATKWLELVAK
jgi:tetratricopeptide (TPR) repeat protein